jgi:peptide/nickel transport system ATP-binding protein
VSDALVAAVEGLVVARVGGGRVLDGVSLRVGAGEVVAVTGPSGAGKSTLLRALIGAIPAGMAIHGGRVEVCGVDGLSATPATLRELRGERIGFVGQDPGRRLNPRMRVRTLLSELAPRSGRHSVQPLLAELALSPELLRRRPGQLSGGQQRRVAIGRALSRQPALLLLDEPTAGLDGALRTELGELLRTLARNRGMAIVLACHDEELVEAITDRVCALGGSAPAPSPISVPAPGSAIAERGRPVVLRGHQLSAWFGRQLERPVLDGVDLELVAGSALAVAGASGAGKTTLARLLIGLHPKANGSLSLHGQPLHPAARRRDPEQRRRLQLVPQDPLGSLNPRHTIGTTLTRPLARHRRCAPDQRASRVAELFDSVGLPAELADRYPDELSGGQRQRVAIARALATEPDVLICDEVTSALDATTADAIMSLLDSLREQRGLALALISHDLRLLADHTDTMLLLEHGRPIAAGPTTTILGQLRS